MKDALVVRIIDWFDQAGNLGAAAFVLLSPLIYAVILPIDLYHLQPEEKEPTTMFKSFCNLVFLMACIFGAVVFLDAWVNSSAAVANVVAAEP